VILDLLTPVHLVIILVIALLLFGPKRLPEIGAGIGKTIKEFRKSMNEVQHDLAVEAKQEPPSENKA
jgi:sec-independent protein translocase protein TatA